MGVYEFTFFSEYWGHRGRDCMVIWFTTTYRNQCLS